MLLSAAGEVGVTLKEWGAGLLPAVEEDEAVAGSEAKSLEEMRDSGGALKVTG